MKANFFLLLILHSSFYSRADQWIQKSDFGGNGRNNAVGFSINGKGYIGTGGAISENYSKTFWEYDPATDVWTQKADLSGVGRESACGFAIGEKGYIVLGQIADNGFTNDLWEYDPDTNSWLQKANFPGSKRDGAFAFVIGTKGYVGAGGNNSSFKQDFWEYDPSSDSWSQKNHYGGGQVISAAAFTIGDKGYVGTGRDNNLEYRKDFWEYDPAIDEWSQKSDFISNPRAGSVAFAIGGSGYLGLGRVIDTSYADFWQYNPVTDSWIQKASYPGGGNGNAAGFSIGGYGYIGTGGASEKQFWQYTPACLAPANLTTLNITSTSAKLKWNASSGVAKYKVQYKVDSTGAPWTAKTVNAANTSIVINNLLAGVQYKWKVRSICNAEKSAYSPVEKFTTQLKLASATAEATTFNVYPNPFAQSSTVSFMVEENSFIKIELFEASGRRIKTLAEAMLEPGRHEIPFDGQGLTAGIYILSLTNSSTIEASKIIIE